MINHTHTHTLGACVGVSALYTAAAISRSVKLSMAVFVHHCGYLLLLLLLLLFLFLQFDCC